MATRTTRTKSDKPLSPAERRAADKVLGVRDRLAERDLSSERAAKYARAVLGSTLAAWFAQNAAAPDDGEIGGRSELERMPVPNLPDAEIEPFIRLVDEIAQAESENDDVGARYLGYDLDSLIYALYGLTEEEDTAIERRMDRIHATDEEEDAAFLRAILEAERENEREFVSEEEVMAILRASDGD